MSNLKRALQDQERKRDTQTLRNILLGSGAVFLAALLLRRGRSGKGAGSGAVHVGTPSASAPAESGRRCNVFIRANRIALDGAPAEASTLVDRCRDGADVQATGGASIQTVVDVVRGLQAAGITVTATDDVWNTLKLAASRE